MKSYTATFVVCGTLFAANVIFIAFMSIKGNDDAYFGSAIEEAQQCVWVNTAYTSVDGGYDTCK